LRNALVAALVSCADTPLKAKARRFLRGLSNDELQFIAEFLGAWILEGPAVCARNRAELAGQIASFQRVRLSGPRERRADQEHKMILLLEYLCRAGAPGRVASRDDARVGA
jgi:hypothetical protein